MNTWKKIGVIGVDSGTCFIGDPCYLIDENTKPNCKSIKEKLENMEADHVQLDYPKTNRPGLGVITCTGVGDGEFSVYEKTSKKGIKQIKIVFE